MSVTIEEVVHEVEGPLSPSDFFERLVALQESLASDAAFYAGEETAVGAGEAAASIGAMAVVGPILLIVGLALLVVFFLSMLHRVLSNIFIKIPIVGGYTVRLFNIILPPTNPLGDWIVAKEGQLIQHLWGDLTTVVGYFATRYILLHHVSTSVSGNAIPTSVNQEIAHLQNEYTSLLSTVNQLWHFVHNASPSPLPQGIVTLPEQIYKLQQDVQVLFHNQQALQNDAEQAFREIHDIGQSLHNLAGQLTSVRSVQVGYQDFVTAADAQFDTFRSQITDLGAEIRSNVRSIGELAPLTLLLEPGIPGLRNLRKLEDKPCQCPQPKFMTPRQIEALAMLEYIENG